MIAVQLDLFAPAPEAPPAPSPPSLPLCLYDSPARGIPARVAEFRGWQREHGSFGSLIRAHAWTSGPGGDPVDPTSRCQAATLSTDLRRLCAADSSVVLSCSCIEADEYLYRGACRHCDWEGDPRPGVLSGNLAAEDALDHAWPGWRDLPVVPSRPASEKALPAWTARILSMHPPGWLEDGGPYRTLRTGLGTRHVPGRTPWGGWDASVLPAAGIAGAG